MQVPQAGAAEGGDAIAAARPSAAGPGTHSVPSDEGMASAFDDDELDIGGIEDIPLGERLAAQRLQQERRVRCPLLQDSFHNTSNVSSPCLALWVTVTSCTS